MTDVDNSILSTTEEPKDAEPQAAAPQVAEPEVAEPEVAEPQAAAPQAAAPQAAAPQVAEPEVAEPEVAEPEVAAHEDAEPEAGPIEEVALRPAAVERAPYPTEPVTINPSPPREGYPSFYASAALVYNTFLSVGASHSFACGMTAQVEAEDAFELVVGDRGEAFGFFQMHGDRVQAVLRGCGIDVRVAGPADQARAAWYELTHTEGRAMAALRAASSPYEAGYWACRLYERAGAAHAPERRALLAERWSTFFGEHPEVLVENPAPASPPESPLSVHVGERVDHGHVGVAASQPHRNIV